MAVKKVMNLGIEISLDSKGAITGIKQTEKAVTRAGQKAKTASKGFSTLKKAVGGLGLVMGTAGLVRGVGAAMTAFGDFEEQLKNVQNITGMSSKEMGKFKSQIEGLPASLGTSVELTKGLYQALSSGVPKENVIGFIEQNAKAAKGNLADLTQTISASASIMNAFGLEGDEVNNVLDAMTKTVDLGVLTFGDLANNVGKASAMAANAGVGYEELFASIAQLTKGGLSVEESVTGVRAMLVGILKPTQDASEAMEDLGIDMSATRLKAEGLAPIMADVGRVIGDDAEAMARIFPNIRALGPALTLAKEDAQGFIDTFAEVKDATGKVDDNFENMTQSINAQMEIMKVEFEKMLQLIGEELAPLFLEVGNSLISILPEVAAVVGMIVEQFGYLFDSVSAIAGIIDEYIIEPLEKAPLAADAVKVLILALAAFKIASLAAAGSLGPFTIAALAIAAAIAGINLAINKYSEHIDKIVDAQNATTDSLEKLNHGMEANGRKWSELAQELGVVADAEHTVAEAIIEELEARRDAGTATAEHLAILGGVKHVSEDVTAAIEASNEALKNATVTEKLAAEQKAKLAKAEAVLMKARKASTKALDEALKAQAKVVKRAQDTYQKAWKQWMGYIENGNNEMSELLIAFNMGLIGLDEFHERWATAIDNLNTDNAEFEMLELAAAAERTAEQIEEDMSGVDPDMSGPRESIMSGISGGLSEALGAGFVGEWTSFRDLWDSLWQDAAKSMMGILGDSFGMFLSGKDADGKPFRFGDMLSSMQEEAGIGTAVGGVGMIMQGREQGGGMGALQGALGGMMAGASFGPIGMAVGAIVGGALAYFGSREGDPQLSFQVSSRDANIYSARGQGMGDEEKEAWRMSAAAIYDSLSDAYRGAYLAMGQNLQELILDAPIFTTLAAFGGEGEIHMDDRDILTWLSQVQLPDMFESQYMQAFSAGLQNFGFNQETIRKLFQDLGRMTGEDRIAALGEFIGTARRMSEQLVEADWGSLKDSLGVDMVSEYITTIQSLGSEMDLMMAGWDDMDLLDVAHEVTLISEAFDDVLEGTLQMLGQIDAVRQNIQDGWAGMQEDLAVSRMDAGEQQGYYQDQVTHWLQQLTEADTLEDIEEANANAMRYIQELMGVVDMDAMRPDGQTWADYFENIMGFAARAADSNLQDIEDVVQAAYQTLVDRLNAASDALLNFTAATEPHGEDPAGTGHYDPVTGDWIPYAGDGSTPPHPTDPEVQPLPGEEESDPLLLDDGGFKNLNVTAPLTVNLEVTIDGQPISAQVLSLVAESQQAMWDAIQGRPPID